MHVVRPVALKCRCHADALSAASAAPAIVEATQRLGSARRRWPADGRLQREWTRLHDPDDRFGHPGVDAVTIARYTAQAGTRVSKTGTSVQQYARGVGLDAAELRHKRRVLATLLREPS